ncbi:MAG: RDD family protein [Planctomycetaceae bacterium]
MDAFTRPLAGFGARLLAYLIDVVPITLAVASIFYFFLGFDEAVRQYVAARDDIDNRIDFLARRNQIRDFSFVVYIIYCGLLEGSAMQGTLGKRLVGVRVTDENGDRLSIARSFGRNFTKIVSYLPLGLGFIWAIWSRRKQGWHDMIARTLVIKR